jgi:hypothetical protein
VGGGAQGGGGSRQRLHGTARSRLTSATRRPYVSSALPCCCTLGLADREASAGGLGLTGCGDCRYGVARAGTVGRDGGEKRECDGRVATCGLAASEAGAVRPFATSDKKKSPSAPSVRTRSRIA